MNETLTTDWRSVDPTDLLAALMAADPAPLTEEEQRRLDAHAQQQPNT